MRDPHPDPPRHNLTRKQFPFISAELNSKEVCCGWQPPPGLLARRVRNVQARASHGGGGGEERHLQRIFRKAANCYLLFQMGHFHQALSLGSSLGRVKGRMSSPSQSGKKRKGNLELVWRNLLLTSSRNELPQTAPEVKMYKPERDIQIRRISKSKRARSGTFSLSLSRSLFFSLREGEKKNRSHKKQSRSGALESARNSF